MEIILKGVNTMKDILKRFVFVFLTIFSCVIQFVALIFESIGCMFNKMSELVIDVTDLLVVEETETEEKEKTSEEVPTEG